MNDYIVLVLFFILNFIIGEVIIYNFIKNITSMDKFWAANLTNLFVSLFVALFEMILYAVIKQNGFSIFLVELGKFLWFTVKWLLIVFVGFVIMFIIFFLVTTAKEKLYKAYCKKHSITPYDEDDERCW